MNEETEALARRAASCSALRWRPGMRALCGEGTEPEWVPDLSDVPTVFALVDLARPHMSNDAHTELAEIFRLWLHGRSSLANIAAMAVTALEGAG